MYEQPLIQSYLSGSTELCLTSQHLTRESSQAVGRDGLDGFFFFLGFAVVTGLGVTTLVFFSLSLSFIVFLSLPLLILLSAQVKRVNLLFLKSCNYLITEATRDLEQAFCPYQYRPGQPFTSKHLIKETVILTGLTDLQIDAISLFLVATVWSYTSQVNSALILLLQCFH